MHCLQLLKSGKALIGADNGQLACSGRVVAYPEITTYETEFPVAKIRLNPVVDYQCTQTAISDRFHCTGQRHSVVSSNLG